MSATPEQPGPTSVGTPRPAIPMALRIMAIILRTLFIGALVAITLRVSGPQSESLASIYETPEDLIRLALGFAACVWLVIHIFMLPKDAEGYRTWLYFGPVIVPLGWLIALARW